MYTVEVHGPVSLRVSNLGGGGGSPNLPGTCRVYGVSQDFCLRQVRSSLELDTVAAPLCQ